MSEQMNCVIMGGDSTLPILCGDIVLSRGHVVAAVITDDRDFANWARQRNLPVVDAAGDLVAAAGTLSFDYLFSINNGHVIPAALLQAASRGAVNYHDGLLPDRAGFYVPVWAILNGEAQHGITWHFMEERLDAGDILHQTAFAVAPDETSFSLNLKCYEAAAASFGGVLDALASGSPERRPQELDRRVYISRWKRPNAACALDWQTPAADLARFARALDFGTYENPFGLPKIFANGEVLLAGSLQEIAMDVSHEPGTVVGVSSEGLNVTTAAGAVRIGKLFDFDGRELRIEEACVRLGIAPGVVLKAPASSLQSGITLRHRAIAPHESYWADKLASQTPLALGVRERTGTLSVRTIDLPAAATESGNSQAWMVSAFVAFLGRVSGEERFDVGFTSNAQLSESAEEEQLFAPIVPFRCQLDLSRPFGDMLPTIAAELADVAKCQTYCRDIGVRYPQLAAAPRRLPHYDACIRLSGTRTTVPSDLDGAVTLSLHPDGAASWISRSDGRIDRLYEQFQRFLALIAAGGCTPASANLLSVEEARQSLVEWNQTAVAFEGDVCIHRLISRQTGRTPAHTAVVCGENSLTYSELETRSNRLANALIARGVGPRAVVGVCLHRGIDLVVTLVAILKTGAAYLPLDPEYPAERLSYIMKDSGAVLAIVSAAVQADLGESTQTFCLDAEADAIARQAGNDPGVPVNSDALCYIIYTSGSTGKPKGVMLRHRNVVNFFKGIDEKIGGESTVWLAVTSISFDISVLELFWTLSNGSKVILLPAEAKLSLTRRVRERRKLDFSLFYFAADASGAGSNPYQLLLDGARFADENGFEAVWTPERHFHSFGGLYPNPSVASAAIAAITKRVKIRAGSVVLPLHNPIRVAEEWSLVDNLSSGRVGISFASGWHARDFALAPANFARNKEVLFEQIEVVRKLWRGEELQFPDGNGVPTPIRTLPRPVQAELPVWVTAAGNPETYRMAGSIGANVLTHLLGQSLEEVGGKIAIYRQALRDAGFDASAGKVTLMLHTYAGETREGVREVVRGPLREYLRTSLDLIKNAPWAFPAFKKPNGSDAEPIKLSDLAPADLEALLDRVFDRYFDHSGLFGTPEDCARMAEKVQEIGVDEIACLIDFGVPSAQVVEGFAALKAARDLFEQNAQSDEDNSIPALIRRHRVTHLQCTPSLAKMLTVNRESKEALQTLTTLLVGGEALPLSLGIELAHLVPTVFNMYGPTETTVWSTMHRVSPQDEVMFIGRPMANTQVYLLDDRGAPVPIGSAGELMIAGDGVAAGYHRRPELTAERFLLNPFGGNSLLYKTGDVARYRPDGTIEFLGRADHQVKIRGHRIEIGEIETVLANHPGVAQAAVVAQTGEDENTRLVAYVVAKDGSAPSDSELRRHLEESLPTPMIPALFVPVERFPLTPNGKLDRKALATLQETRTAVARPRTVYANPVEETIATIWRDSLSIDDVGPDENLSELGAHSLLMVQVHAKLAQALTPELTLIDMFRFPTVRQLSAFVQSKLQGRDSADDATVEVAGSHGLSPSTLDRVAMRRELLAKRANARG